MAEMYKELAEGYQMEVSASEISGQRVFQRNDTAGTVAVASLPTVGTSLMKDVYGSDVTGCKCRSKTYKFAGNKSTVINIVFKYSTKVERGGGGASASGEKDENQRRFDMGGEVVSIDEPKDAWVWDSDSSTVDQPIYKSVVTGTFTRNLTGLSDEDKTTFIGLVKNQAGTINSAAFEDFAIGQVLFTGISGGTYYDDEGVKKWSFELGFSYRIIRDEMESITQDDWLYILNKNTHTWDKPKTATGGKFLYEKTDLALLLE